MYLIDGYQGEAHITAAQVGDFNLGTVGSSCVLDTGEQFRAETVSGNGIRIYDGAAVIQGRRCGIQAGSYEDVTIENGTQGQNRIDVIVIRYEKESSNKENVSIEVIKGTPSSGTPAAPSVTAGDIREGDNTCQMALYQVRLQGINIQSVTAVFPTTRTIVDMGTAIATLQDTVANLFRATAVDTVNTGEPGVYVYYNTTPDSYAPDNINKGLLVNFCDPRWPTSTAEQPSFMYQILIVPENNSMYYRIWTNGISYGQWYKINVTAAS